MPYDPPAMNFDFSADQKSLREQARKFLGEHSSSARVRRILEGAAPFDAELWRGMGEMGWMGTAIPETHGGAGFACACADHATITSATSARTPA